MADFEKLFKKLQKKFDKAVDESHDNGYDEGWSEGYDSGHEVGRTDGFAEGVEAHKTMIRTRLTMLFDTYMSTDKFAKAKDVKETLEYLEWEYDPEKAAEEAKADDDKWF
jgi:flagellar biosynthesis/type III secretory pathway protein FliH